MVLSTCDVLARCPLFAELTDDDLDALGRIASCRPSGRDKAFFYRATARRACTSWCPDASKSLSSPPNRAARWYSKPNTPIAPSPNCRHSMAERTRPTLKPSRTAARCFSKTAFLGLLRERPAISPHLIRTLGQRLRRLVGLVEQLSFQEVIHRLASYLLNRRTDGLPFDLEADPLQISKWFVLRWRLEAIF